MYQELRKKLERLGLKPIKIKKPQRFQNMPHCFVTFPSEADREVGACILYIYIYIYMYVVIHSLH